uniref:Uncharacterized protein n=1 Tax=Glossina palpalis gambiensis TaxID=67801 RepID=A0A1B0BEN9_9MUSC
MNVTLMILIEVLTFPGTALTTGMDVLWTLGAFAREKIGVTLNLTLLNDGAVIATLVATMAAAAIVVGMVVYLMLILHLTLMVMIDMLLCLKMIPAKIPYVLPAPQMVGTMTFDVLMILEAVVAEKVAVFLARKRFLMLAFDMGAVSMLALYPILARSLVLPLMMDVVLLLRMILTILTDVVLIVNVVLTMLIEVLTFPGTPLLAVWNVLWILGAFATEKIGVTLNLTLLIDGAVNSMLFLTTMADASIVVGMALHLELILYLTLTVMIHMLLCLERIPVKIPYVITAPEMVWIMAFDVLMTLEAVVTEDAAVFLAPKRFLMLAFDMAAASMSALPPILVQTLVLPLMTNVVLVLRPVLTRQTDVVLTVTVVLTILIEVLTFPGMALIAVLNVLWILGEFAKEKIDVIVVLKVLTDVVMNPKLLLTTMVDAGVTVMTMVEVVPARQMVAVKRFLKLAFDMAAVSMLALHPILVRNLVLPLMANVVLVL